MYTKSIPNSKGARGEPDSGPISREGTESAPAWVAEAPLLAGERGVHIATRIGIVGVEAAGAVRLGDVSEGAHAPTGHARTRDGASSP